MRPSDYNAAIDYLCNNPTLIGPISDFGIEVTAALDFNDTADLMVTITKNFL